MSAFKGKSVKNKSKLRKQKKELEFALKQEGSPLGEILSGGAGFNRDLDKALTEELNKQKQV